VAIQQVESDDEGRRAARNALEPIIARGLVRRMGRFIIPVMVVKPGMLSDWVAWETIRRAFEGVGGETSDVRCALWVRTFISSFATPALRCSGRAGAPFRRAGVTSASAGRQSRRSARPRP
jgi:hypothetical protein